MNELCIEKSKAQCNNCKRDFADGKDVYSSLYKQDAEFTRADYCPSCWESMDKSAAFSYWKRILEIEGKEKENIDAVLAFFKELIRKDAPDPKEARIKYILCLILMRRKQLRHVGMKKTPDGNVMTLEKRWDGETIDILDTFISEDEFDELKGELDKLLGNPQ